MACEVAKVSRQAFGAWRAHQRTGPNPGELAEADLIAEIRQVHGEFDGTYGEPR